MRQRHLITRMLLLASIMALASSDGFAKPRARNLALPHGAQVKNADFGWAEIRCVRWYACPERPDRGTEVDLRRIHTDMPSQLDFAHFGAARGHRPAQKIGSKAMMRRASSSGATVRPKGPTGAQCCFHDDQ